jgi:hypothetical protein
MVGGVAWLHPYGAFSNRGIALFRRDNDVRWSFGRDIWHEAGCFHNGIIIIDGAVRIDLGKLWIGTRYLETNLWKLLIICVPRTHINCRG